MYYYSPSSLHLFFQIFIVVDVRAAAMISCYMSVFWWWWWLLILEFAHVALHNVRTSESTYSSFPSPGLAKKSWHTMDTVTWKYQCDGHICVYFLPTRIDSVGVVFLLGWQELNKLNPTQDPAFSPLLAGMYSVGDYMLHTSRGSRTAVPYCVDLL